MSEIEPVVGLGDLVRLDLKSGGSLFGVVQKIGFPFVYVLWDDNNLGVMTYDGSSEANAWKLQILEKSK